MATATRPRPTVPMTASQQADLERRHAETQRRVLRELVRFEESRYLAECARYRSTLDRTSDVRVRAEKARYDSICAKFNATRGRTARHVALAQLDRVNALAKSSGRAVDLKKLGKAARASGAIEHKSLPFSVKVATTSESPSFSGWGAVFNNVDSVGDIIVPGAFAQDLAEFLQDGFIGGLGHNWDQPIARVKSAREDGKGLFIESGPIVGTSHGTDVAKLLRAGVVRKLSIGYRAIEPRQLDDPVDVEAYWSSRGYTPSALDRERSQKGVRLLTRVKLLEVSPVTMAANHLADIAGVKGRPARTA